MKYGMNQPLPRRPVDQSRYRGLALFLYQTVIAIAALPLCAQLRSAQLPEVYCCL